MKNIIATIFISVFILGASVSGVRAQMMQGGSAITDDHTAREEAEGKAVWEKIQAKQTTCSDLSDKNFETLGEYFMGQMTGTSHEAMNSMMKQMIGKGGEEQMHVVMGKRLSSCDTSATFPSEGISLMPMMNMMMGGWSSPAGSNQTNNPMMNFGFTSFGGFGWIFMILWWVLIIAGIIALIKWLSGQSRGTHNHEKSPLEILKERYARGEIDKEEFDERKKDLS